MLDSNKFFFFLNQIANIARHIAEQVCSGVDPYKMGEVVEGVKSLTKSISTTYDVLEERQAQTHAGLNSISAQLPKLQGSDSTASLTTIMKDLKILKSQCAPAPSGRRLVGKGTNSTMTPEGLKDTSDFSKKFDTEFNHNVKVGTMKDDFARLSLVDVQQEIQESKAELQKVIQTSQQETQDLKVQLQTDRKQSQQEIQDLKVQLQTEIQDLNVQLQAHLKSVVDAINNALLLPAEPVLVPTTPDADAANADKLNKVIEHLQVSEADKAEGSTGTSGSSAHEPSVADNGYGTTQDAW